MAPDTRHLCIIFATLSFITSKVNTCPTGAPKEACAAAAPMHYTEDGEVIKPHEGPSPYSFTVDADVYKVGQQISVTIEGSQAFGGFLIQARRVGGGEEPVGQFSSLPDNSQLRGCMKHRDGVTHTNPESKLPGMMFMWSTKEDVGPIEFFGTVAQNHDVFWTEIRSKEIQNATDSQNRYLKFNAIKGDIHNLENKATSAWKTMLRRNRTIVFEDIYRKRQHQDD